MYHARRRPQSHISPIALYLPNSLNRLKSIFFNQLSNSFITILQTIRRMHRLSLVAIGINDLHDSDLIVVGVDDESGCFDVFGEIGRNEAFYHVAFKLLSALVDGETSAVLYGEFNKRIEERFQSVLGFPRALEVHQKDTTIWHSQHLRSLSVINQIIRPIESPQRSRRHSSQHYSIFVIKIEFLTERSKLLLDIIVASEIQQCIFV